MRDAELVLLVRHLHDMHHVLTVADFDAAGWSIVNTYPGKLRPAKRKKFFDSIGKRRAGENVCISGNGAKVLAFKAPEP